MPAAGYVLEPRPTNNAVEDDDDCVQTPNAERQNAERQTLPQSFDLLQHSFGDFADLAWGQE
jgi:hypothetical protein